ncbi:MAG: TonB-dependent receptor [Alistipes sp.]
MKQVDFLMKLSGVIRKICIVLCILTVSTAAYAQKQVTGTIQGNDGVPLPGTNVLIKGSSVGTIAGADGRYAISAKPSDVLVFSFLGMESNETAVGMRTTIDVQLKPQSLEEVVVVGYGTQKKASLTGSISQINGDELVKGPAMNVSSMIGGRLTGVSSVQESGQPGDDQASLIVRGSRYGVTYIVDGMPRSINDIDPSNVESVSVLKDAAAAAIYGLKSAGGVVIITTKKGERGECTINYTGSFGASTNANFPRFLDGPEFAYYYNKGLEMDGQKPIFTQEMVDKMCNGDDSDGWGNTDWVKKTFGTGFNQKHNVTVQGGNDRIRYFSSLGYQNQKGNIDNFTFKRYNLRSNVEAQIARSLKFSLNIAGSFGDQNSPGFAAGGSEGGGGSEMWMSIAHQAISAHPYLPTTYEGLPVASPGAAGRGSSPLASVNDSGYNRNKSLNVQTTIGLEWKLPWVDGLTARVNGSYDHGYSTSKILATPYSIMQAEMPSASQSDIVYAKKVDVRDNTYNTLGEGLSRSTQMVGNFSLNYVKTFAENHHLDVMLLGELRDYKENSFAAYGKGLPFVELPELDYTQPADSPISGHSDASRSAGFVGRVRYDYANKYLVELSGRYDGSYKFNGNVGGKRWGFFPAASFGWRVSQESFMKNVNWIDDLKLRFSVGETGSDAISPYKFLNTYGLAPYGTPSPIYHNGNAYNTLYLSSVANPYLTWERVRSYDFGFDWNMWRGKLDVTFDVFYNYNFDILTSMGGNAPSSVGKYYMDVENYSESDTKGVEFSISHRNKVGSGKNVFRYNVGLNFTYAYTRWLRYPDSPNNPDYQKLVGKEIGSMLGWVTDGLYQSEEEIDASPWTFGQRPRVGDIKYVDVNGDGTVEYQDKIFTGRSNRPEITMGLNLGFGWRGFDVSMLFTAAAKFDVSLTGTYFNGYDDNTIYTETFKEGGNSPAWLVKNAWTPEHPNAEYPRLTINSPTNNNGLASTFWFRDGKYLRLKTLQIGYNLPDKLLRSIHMKGIRVFFEGQNLFTISGLPEGIDPESPGVNNGYYPQQRIYMGGLSITF